MNKAPLLALSSLFLLVACVSGNPEFQKSGQGYLISAQQRDAVYFRMLDAMNALRRSQDLAPLSPNAALNAAAATHSRDMAMQNRPWHFGSDGSSPLLRVQRAGYQGELLGEAISETFETELQTLSAWIKRPDTRAIILSPDAQEMGFAWFQEPSNKIWWTLITGKKTPSADAMLALSQHSIVPVADFGR